MPKGSERRRIAGVSCAALALVLAASAGAQNFRRMNPIPVPEEATRDAIRQGQAIERAATAVARPVSRAVVEEAVRRIYEAYNTPEFARYMGPEFFDASRLADAIVDRVPRDARMRLLSVQSVRTVAQTTEADPQGTGNLLVSTVFVVVRAQLEFNDLRGFQRREGVSELILRIRERGS